MAGYESARALAERIIAKRGRRDGVLRRPGADAVPNPARPWAPDDADPTQDVALAENLAVVVLEASTFREDKARLAEGTTAVAGGDAQLANLGSLLLQAGGSL